MAAKVRKGWEGLRKLRGFMRVEKVEEGL